MYEKFWLKEIRKSKNCDCYECAETEYIYNEGHKSVKNNMKYHTLLEPCEECGRPKTEYRDLGTKGYYICWWCNIRADP